MLLIIHHWLLPVISAGVWFGMLWAMLIYWLAKGRPVYPWSNGSIAFISDVGASPVQPLFIAGSSVMAVFFILSVAADRLLRHQSRLPRNMRQTERVLSYCAIAGATIGGAGIILVSCFNTHLYPHMHDGFLGMFIIGVALSAIFTTIEYRYLDKHEADGGRLHNLLKASYVFKIFIVSLDILLAIVFAILLSIGDKVHNAAAVVEWLISFLFTFYVLSFAWDLWPAAKADKGEFKFEEGIAAAAGAVAVAGTKGMEKRDSDRLSDQGTLVGSPETRTTKPEHDAFSNEKHAPALDHSGHPVREFGREGGATAIGTGEDRSFQHYDDQGRVQHAL